MHAHKFQAVVPANHLVAVQLPDDFPAGPVEIIVLATTEKAAPPNENEGKAGANDTRTVEQ